MLVFGGLFFPVQKEIKNMNTPEEVELAFRSDLKVLLNKYNAELEAEDHYEGWPECGQNIKVTAYITIPYDENKDINLGLVTIDLGSFICPDSL